MGRIDENLGSMSYDNLIAGVYPAAEVSHLEVKGGQGVLERGTLLAAGDSGLEKIAAGTTGKANAVLAEAIDTAEETVAVVYRTGHFNANSLIVADGYKITAEDKEALRGVGILISDAVEV